MANEEHLKILKQGVEVWNQWRKENEFITPDLSGADLSATDLSMARLSEAHLEGANLYRSNLSETSFTNANLRKANLQEANLSDAYLSEADLRYANLSETRLDRAIFSDASLMVANLQKAHLDRTLLQGSFLINANLTQAQLQGANLTGADIREANLSKATLSEVILIEADLAGSKLIGCNLYNSDLTRANIQEADLSEADLHGVIFRDTNIIDTRFLNSHLLDTNFLGVNLSTAIGLETVIHRSPSYIDVRTLTYSRGEIPDAFLRGCGLSDWEIENTKLYNPELSNEEINNIQYRIHDLRVKRAIQINPLFISYSHSNSDFVDAIERKLIENGVRFWRDIHHAKAGRLEKQIDDAIHLNDVVLVVLSEHSTNSDWVEHEVRKARAKEKTGKDALCPVALDDSWKTCHWPERLREQIMEYNILDFSNWQDEVIFQRQFTKLLEGLNLFYK